jgi:hypothetical protein
VKLSEVKRRLSKTTNRLQRHIEAIRNQEVHPGAFVAGEDFVLGRGGGETWLRRRAGAPTAAGARTNTLDYPIQGKLQTVPAQRVGYVEWEPAESLYIAILVGPDDLDSGTLRDQLRNQRRQRHDAIVYRWQGEFTLDVIGFDAIDLKADRESGRVDLVLMSDRLLGNRSGPAVSRELERIALQTRFRFRDSYLVGLMSDPADTVPDPMAHPFHGVERKARAKGVTVFDQHVPRELDHRRLTRLLVSFAKSRRYAPDRNVWLTPEFGDAPLPIPKEDVSPGC